MVDATTGLMCVQPPEAQTSSGTEDEFNACLDNSNRSISAGIGAGPAVSSLPPAAKEPALSLPPPTNTTSQEPELSAGMAYTVPGFGIGAMGASGGPMRALVGGGLHQLSEKMERLEEIASDIGTRALGAIGVLGGGAEAVAGGITFVAGAGTSELGIGIPVAILGGAMVTHGVDTVQANARTVWTGETTETETSGLLQDAGMSPVAANLTDAGIGIAFSLGSAAITKSPRVAAAIIPREASALQAADEAQSAAAATAQADIGGTISVAMRENGGHLRVRAQVGTENAAWSELKIVEGKPKIRNLSYEPNPTEYRILHVTVPAENARRAAIQTDELIRNQWLGGTMDYVPGERDCQVYVANILDAAGLPAPHTAKTTELLGEMHRIVDPVLEQADANFKLANTLGDTPEADWLRAIARHTIDEADPIRQQYVMARSQSIMDATEANAAAFDNLRQLHIGELDEASRAYSEAAAAFNAAYAAQTMPLRVTTNSSIGAHSLQATEETILINLDADAVIEIVPEAGSSAPKGRTQR